MSSAKKSLDCAAPKYQPNAEALCKPLIEGQAKFDAKWDSFFSPIFQPDSWGWADKARTTIVYMGQEVKFQNAYNVYVPMVYACTINLKTLEVTDLKVMPRGP